MNRLHLEPKSKIPQKNAFRSNPSASTKMDNLIFASGLSLSKRTMASLFTIDDYIEINISKRCPFSVSPSVLKVTGVIDAYPDNGFIFKMG